MTDGGQHSADLIGVNGIHFEVKRTERLSLYPAIKQAERDAGENCPVVVHIRNGKRWLAIIYLGDFTDIADNINKIKGRN